MAPGDDAGPEGGRRFETTQWSLVLAAGEGGSAAALERLCASYWLPVYAFVRRRGYRVEDAQDLTQGFFARLIEKGDLRAADRERGRFRSFLLTNCQYYLANERDRASAQKRGGGRAAIPIDFDQAPGLEAALAHEETPERLYDRQWCLTLLDGVLTALRDEHAGAGKAEVFDRLKEFLTGSEGAGSHAEAAADLGMTPGAVKVAVHRLRRRYRDELRRRVAETVASEADVDDEIRHLLRSLGPGGEGL